MEKYLEKEIAWAGFEFRVPAEWDIRSHSVSCLSGSLALVDRRRHRLELIWRRCDEKPDLNLSYSDLKGRVKNDTMNGEVFGVKSIPGWLAFEAQMDEETVVVYALCWRRESGRIFQVTVVTRDEDHFSRQGLLETILAGFSDSGWEGRSVRWKAFGIDCASPPGWHLVSTRVNPMDVNMQFQPSGKKGEKTQASVHRLGMADTWFSGDPKAFLRGKEPGLDLEFEGIYYNGHEAVAARAQAERRLILRLFGRGRIRRELVWLCEPMNSLFRVYTVSPENEGADPQDFAVRCGHTYEGKSSANPVS